MKQYSSLDLFFFFSFSYWWRQSSKRLLLSFSFRSHSLDCSHSASQSVGIVPTILLHCCVITEWEGASSSSRSVTGKDFTGTKFETALAAEAIAQPDNANFSKCSHGF
jgi:hypothetical protein